MKFVIFVDALDPVDVKQACPEMYNDMKDMYDVGVPRVTPNIVSQVMTGKKPEEMEMIRSTPKWEPSEEEDRRWKHEGGDPVEAEEGPERNPMGDPVQGQRRVGIHPYDNILESLDEKGVSVFQYGTPFCSFVDLENGMSVHDEMTNPAAPDFMNFASPPVSFMEDDWDMVADCYISDTVLELETLKQIARQENVDTVFLGYKHIDHCTHWYAPNIKKDVIKVIWAYIQDLREMGHEVVWWSDHGSQKKNQVFNINKWLKENGFLDYSVDEKFAEKLEEKGITDSNFDQQMQLDHPAVEVNWDGSVAFSTDAFDSMVDVTEDAKDAQIEQVKKELNEHPAVKNVWRKQEVMDEEADKYWYAPEIIVERDNHVLVTGNVHPDVPSFVEDVPDDWEQYPYDNMGKRPGVHSRHGCIGGDIPITTQIEDGKPHQIREVLEDFVIIEEGNVDEKRQAELEREAKETLKQALEMDGINFLWTGGKEAQVLAHMLLEDIGEEGEQPAPFTLIDTGNHFEEMRDFRNRFIERNDLDVEKVVYEELLEQVILNEEDPRGYHGKWDHSKSLPEGVEGIRSQHDEPETWGIEESCGALKVNGIKKIIQNGDKVLITGQRAEDSTLGHTESKQEDREEPLSHSRINPLVNWDRENVWRYINKKNVDYCELYDQGYNHTDSKCCTERPEDVGEYGRKGVDIEKRQVENKLQEMGYI
jgi:3'-phosphoadenosine 5'-phosphosulfate sulfotransferase (PAPS reductase)/FAD synthetase